MPDCHAGAGCVIGTTMTVGDKVCPNLVGVDIGCGVLCVKLEEKANQIDLKRIDEICHQIPSGKNVYEAEQFCADRWLSKLKCFPHLKNIQRLGASLGTLGGGNHFIELDVDSQKNVWLLIHSGSRNLGKQVAEYYQSLAYERHNNHQKEIKSLIENLKAQGRMNEIQTAIDEFKASHQPVSNELYYLEGLDLDNYLHDMELCQVFAQRNRTEIARTILKKYYGEEAIGEDFKVKSLIQRVNKIKTSNYAAELEHFETVHNYINFDDMILRKGAVSANTDELLIIPMNMRDGALLCKGKGNPDWNNSAPHGAGRLMSRAEARRSVRLDDYVKSMVGVYTTTVDQTTIDESPMVYKPMDSIIENVEPTVDIVDILIPIYNFKASE